MRTFILTAMVVLFLGACSSYQYLTLNSSQMPKNDSKEFTWENDTMRLVYNFHGKGGPINLTVFNKTSQPLFLNWKKSALIRDGHSTVLFNHTVLINGSAVNSSFSSAGHTRTGYSNLSAQFDLPEGTEFLPPHTDLSKSLVKVQDTGFGDIGIYQHAQPISVLGADGVSSKAKRVAYEEQVSPVQFKIYLTFVLGNNSGQEFSLEHSFYATEIIQSDYDPELYTEYGKDGDKLFVKETMN